MCRVLQVSRSGYYAWIVRPKAKTELHRQSLLAHIRSAHSESRESYGSPRVYRELKARGVRVCENTVAKLMRLHGVQSKARKRFRVRTTDSNHSYSVVPNVLDRQFDQEQPNKVWVADITYVPTDEGWLYLAAIIDLYSRQVVGWATADHLRAELACNALHMAIQQRRPEPNLLHHSDRGVQYASDAYQALLAKHQMRPSMSGRADCYDNAVIESFFATLKCELIYQERFPTREHAQRALFEYIEVFYNRRRRHSSLNYLSPQQFEAAA
jgi:putative transposase